MEDTRCCGTGTCIINAEGYCWCGQKWDGTKMCFPDKDRDQAVPERAGSGPDPRADGAGRGGPTPGAR